MKVKEADRQHRRCKCGGDMPHRYSYDFVRGLYRAQCVCERCGARTVVQYARRQHAAITAAYAAPRVYKKIVE